MPVDSAFKVTFPKVPQLPMAEVEQLQHSLELIAHKMRMVASGEDHRVKEILYTISDVMTDSLAASKDRMLNGV